MPRKLIAICLGLLMACAPRGEMTLAPPGTDLGAVESIYVGTSRNLLAEGGFGNDRSETVSFGRYDVSIPQERELGEINWPPKHGKPDPKRHFLTTEAALYPGEASFRRDLSQALRANGGEAVIFVHGYNNNYSEGIYRVAQFAHDLDLPGAVVHYAWPSAAQPLGYVYDRDSALFARAGLERLLDEVAAAGAQRILVVAHSMGSALTMEALRSAALRGNSRSLPKVSGVILISPDLDVDVFREQARTIGKLPQPFVIFGSSRDKILRISAGLTGKKERLGSLSDLSRVADLEVTFLDVGAFAKGASHFVPADSPALILLLNRIADIEGAFETDRVGRIGLLPGVVMTVQNATEIILTPIGAIGSGSNAPR